MELKYFKILENFEIKLGMKSIMKICKLIPTEVYEGFYILTTKGIRIIKYEMLKMVFGPS